CFFFQAEDGIRDFHVTGVQTCALPISAWTPGRIGKRARGLFPDRPVALLASVGTEDHALRWKDSVTSPAELTSFIVDGFVHGGRDRKSVVEGKRRGGGGGETQRVDRTS